MADISDLDRLIEDNVRAFDLEQFKRRQLALADLTPAEREQLLDQTLGPATQLIKGETFVIGKEAAGVTSKSVWFEKRRIHFAVIVGVAVGDAHNGDQESCWVDINCTARRSYRIRVRNVLQADAFLVGLSRFTSFKIVPTFEDELRELALEQEKTANTEAKVDQRSDRTRHLLARQHRELMGGLVQIQSSINDIGIILSIL